MDWEDAPEATKHTLEWREKLMRISTNYSSRINFAVSDKVCHRNNKSFIINGVVNTIILDGIYARVEILWIQQ